MKRFVRQGMKIGPVVTALLVFLNAAGVSAESTVITLRESIDTALRNSVIIDSAREAVKGAQAQKNEAVTAFLPKFSTSYNYTRLHEQPTTTTQGILPGHWVTVPVGTKDNYYWTVEAKQPVFAGGSILANYQFYRQGLDASRGEEERTVQNIVMEVKTSYFNVLKAGKILEAAEQSVELLKAHRNTSQQFFDVGLIPKNDLLYSEVELANGEQNLVHSQNGLELAKARFNTVLRRDIAMDVTLEDTLTDIPFQASLDDCLKTALDNRPELKFYRLQVDQARSLVKIARSGYFPSVSVIGNYSKFGDDPDVSGSDYRDQESWQVMAVANWDFWEWGKTKFRVDYSLARENQTKDALLNVRDQIVLEVKDAYLMVKEAEKQISVSRKAIEQAEENYRINKERYQEQVATSTEVLDAQTILTRAKSDHANALGDYHINQSRLERAMGIIR